MIEIEKKYKMTEQLHRVVDNSIYIEKEEIHDTYFDFKNYELLKKDIRFRLREIEDKSFYELKIRNESGGDYEIENVEEIKKYFNTDLNIKEFIEKNLVVFMEYNTERLKYQNGEFKICVDRLESLDSKFIFDTCEVELMIENEKQMLEAELKIDNFALSHDLERQKTTKRAEYLKVMNPSLYQEIFEEKMMMKELRMN